MQVLALSHLQQVLREHYTVTYTIAAAGGCAVFTTTASVTITAAPSATISYAGTPFCTSVGTSQSVTQTGTAGGTYSSTAGLTINAGTGAITPSTSTPGTYTVTYTIAAAGGCAVFYNDSFCDNNCCSKRYDQLCGELLSADLLQQHKQ
jgi:hypothetical protein